jgi:hypothetical protein
LVIGIKADAAGIGIPAKTGIQHLSPVPEHDSGVVPASAFFFILVPDAG